LLSADIYRLGITLMELGTLRSCVELKVFSSQTNSKTASAYLYEIEKKYGKAFHDVVAEMLKSDPKERVTMKELYLKHLPELMAIDVPH
jgi:serine/threonine protein kinase